MLEIFWGLLKLQVGHGVVKVLNIEEFDSTKWKNSKEGLRAELSTRKEREAYSEWMKDLREDADIVDNRKYHFYNYHCHFWIEF